MQLIARASKAIHRNGALLTSAATSLFHASFVTGAYSKSCAGVCCPISLREPGARDATRKSGRPDVPRAKNLTRLKILWDFEVAIAFPGVALSIVASDVDQAMLARAREGCFEPTSLHELPPTLIEQGFDRLDSRYCVKPEHREGVEFLDQDLRTETPARLFDLILCRYVAFTYFAVPLQRKVLASMLKRLRPQGYLVIGTHEQLPSDVPELAALDSAPQIFQKRAVSA